MTLLECLTRLAELETYLDDPKALLLNSSMKARAAEGIAAALVNLRELYKMCQELPQLREMLLGLITDVKRVEHKNQLLAAEITTLRAQQNPAALEPPCKS